MPYQHLVQAARQHGTPCWVYDASVIRARIRQLRGFDVIRFAQKACSNIHILRLMREQGVKVDAVSLGEIERALLAGFTPGLEQAELVFTSDLMDEATLKRVVQLKVEVNAGSIDMLHQLGPVSPGHRVWLRINPGFGHGHSQQTNTGGPNSKHGIWHEQLGEALAAVRDNGLHLVGIHMHIGSGADYQHLQSVCAAMVETVKRLDYPLEAISAGGGLSTPYRDQDEPVDVARYVEVWQQAKAEIEAVQGHALRLEIEPGRFLMAESGSLISEVRATKNMGENHFVLVDAGFNDLMRPAMYGSYHRMTLLDAEGAAPERPLHATVVAGPLCESGDVFTQNDDHCIAPRLLPEAQVGDLLVIHDTGAYGASMSSNYNSRPLLPEVLVDEGRSRLIRRRQTLGELFRLELEVE
ncbi:diaminopimelate decarboxylase [Pseudomonas sp. UBA4194]|uniref:diaminopimelate decarboxylase n=1 Tax=Pseudomonas sp. UBA4194 TaxID=1947317 RepID=UPI0025FC0500|nr:diaminopimelate decarboxylase [Pseudomonas sp. UBA4194]